MITLTACIAILLQKTASLSISAVSGQLDKSSFIQAQLQHGRNDSVSKDLELTGKKPAKKDSANLDFKYMGCFYKRRGNDTDFKLLNNGKLNASTCMQTCVHENSSYFALQDYGDCVCGRPHFQYSALQKYTTSRSCGYVCASEIGMGTGAHMCGNSFLRALYQIVWLKHGDENHDVSAHVEPFFKMDLVIPNYLSCITRKQNDSHFELSIKSTFFNRFNAMECMKGCLHKKRLYFALNNDGNSCYCGKPDFNLSSLEEIKKSKSCGNVCASEVGLRPTHWCGNAEKRAVYNAYGISASWFGCYKDDKEDKRPDLLFERPGLNFTSESCMQSCFKYKYMALQNSGKSCFCGNKYSKDQKKAIAVDDQKCGGPCGGEEGISPARPCGQPTMNAIYKIQRRAVSDTELREFIM